MTARRIIRTYLGIAASTTLAQSLIWGVNTLFLLSVGLDIFQVMVVNAAYTVAQVFFEVPTGVIADTLGRRVSYLLAVGIIFVSTLLYMCVRARRARACVRSRSPRRCSGWATPSTPAPSTPGWSTPCTPWTTREGSSPSSPATAWSFGVFMLIGTTAGGFLGQLDLWIPYAVRAVVLVPAFLLGLLVMRDLGFAGRKLTLGQLRRRDAAHRPRRRRLRPA